MEVLGFIPARGGSKGVPNKNIKLLGYKPLVAYTIEESLKSKITRLIVSTDSQEIAETCQAYGAEVPFYRPAGLAQDDSYIEDAIQYSLNLLQEKENYFPDIIVLLHPTTPFRRSKHIDDCIQLLVTKGADSVVSVSVPMEHPCDMIYWDDEGEMQFLLASVIVPGKSQRQDYPECLFLNGAVYAFTYENFAREKSRFGPITLPYLMKQIDSIDIDSEDDFEIAEAIMNRKRMSAIE